MNTWVGQWEYNKNIYEILAINYFIISKQFILKEFRATARLSH